MIMKNRYYNKYFVRAKCCNHDSYIIRMNTIVNCHLHKQIGTYIILNYLYTF